MSDEQTGVGTREWLRLRKYRVEDDGSRTLEETIELETQDGEIVARTVTIHGGTSCL